MDANPLMSVDPQVIGERLAAARRARGLTQQEAAQALGVARTTITAMEKGDRRPRAAEIYTLARLYGRQIGELVRPDREGESPSFAIQFRSARSQDTLATASLREQDIQRFEDFCRWYSDLEAMLDARLPMRYPEEYDVSGTNAERAAADVAAAERNRLGLGDGPIGDLRGLLETDAGLRIFAFPMQDRRTSGMFLSSSDLGACVAINADHPAERQRWTQAHEYWHFLTERYKAEITVLKSGRLPHGERAADAFARHFLMPAPGLTRRYLSMKRAKQGPITPADVLTLAHLYGVSLQAMTLRLEELDLLKAGTWDSLREKGFKPEKARALIELPAGEGTQRSLPYRYETLAARAYEDALISEGQLARMLATDRTTALQLVRARALDDQPSDTGEWRQIAINLGEPLVEVG